MWGGEGAGITLLFYVNLCLVPWLPNKNHHKKHFLKDASPFKDIPVSLIELRIMESISLNNETIPDGLKYRFGIKV